MRGQEMLNRVRWYAGDVVIGNFIEINRALRKWCQMAGLPWLRETRAAAVLFTSGDSRYDLAGMGLRRIDRVFVEEATSGRWLEMEEYQPPGFEAFVRKRVDADGTTDAGRPRIYSFTGSVGQLAIKISPEPDADYPARIDGVAETPVVSWADDLPGPAEYHDHVAMLAAGYHTQHAGRVLLRQAASEVEIMRAQQMIGIGKSMEGEALAELVHVTADALQNRLKDLRPIKLKLAR